MDYDMIEKKVHYLGAWQEDRVDQAVIADINHRIHNEKGNKVKLQLSRDGLRVLKNTLIQGKMLQDYIPLDKIQFMTASQRMPDLLIVIALSRELAKTRFQVLTFRCANPMDVAIYTNAFGKVKRMVKTVTVVKAPATKGSDQEEINWTLRNKQQDNSKRELKKLVDLHGEKAILHKTETHTTVIPNGHNEVYETGVRIPLYRKGRPSRIESTMSDDMGMDSRSEVSESALRQELDSLSQELRDIKLMLENSTGVNAGTASEPGSPRDFRPVNVEVQRQTVSRPESVVVSRTEQQDVQAVVIDDDDEEVQMRHKQNGYHVATAGNAHHVRISVPDYRGSEVEEKTSTKVEDAGYGTSYRVTKVNSGYITEPPREPSREMRPVTTSYESWKQDTLTRNSVAYKDIPDRVQWRSQSAHPRHVVTTRTRSAIPTFSSGGNVQVRHQSAGYGPTYQRMGHVHTARMHDNRAHSMRSSKGLSTTIARPIEKVYTGRSDAKHHSIVMRQSGERPSILMKNGSVRGSQVFAVEQNNNVVKTDTNDTNLLDVSGMDLYNMTPHETTVIDGNVIRT